MSRTTSTLTRRSLLALTIGAATARVAAAQARSDPLPSWRAGATKSAILDFLSATTTPGNPDFVAPAERLATFDNDGTLWVEQPLPTQVIFAFDRVRALAPQHPEWRQTEPFRSVLANDMAGVARAGERGLLEIIAATHSGMSPEAFHAIVLDWIGRARHPRFDRPYTELAYQPMLEVLAAFRAAGYRTCIVSGGTVEFMRPWSERVYGVPPEQVVGTTLQLRYANGNLMRLPQLDVVNDGPGKAIGISRFLARRPIAAFGNTDGDYEMLEYATSAPGRRLGVIVHHDDGEREYAYDRDAPVGKLDRALTDAPAKRWIVASMRNDWTRIFP